MVFSINIIRRRAVLLRLQIIVNLFVLIAPKTSEISGLSTAHENSTFSAGFSPKMLRKMLRIGKTQLFPQVFRQKC